MTSDMSPKVKARLVGGFLLLTMLAGGFAQGFIGGRLIVSGDAAATAASIVAHEPLYRLAVATQLVESACQIAMILLLFELRKPVSRRAPLARPTFGPVGWSIQNLLHRCCLEPVLVL